MCSWLQLICKEIELLPSIANCIYLLKVHLCMNVNVKFVSGTLASNITIKINSQLGKCIGPNRAAAVAKKQSKRFLNKG